MQQYSNTSASMDLEIRKNVAAVRSPVLEPRIRDRVAIAYPKDEEKGELTDLGVSFGRSRP